MVRNAERVGLQCDRDSTPNDTEQLSARFRELKCELANLDNDRSSSRALSVDLARSDWNHRRAEMVRRDAGHVWGADWQGSQPKAQTVYRLTGMSAEEIRNVASCVNQSVTSAEEHAAQNRLANTPLEY